MRRDDESEVEECLGGCDVVSDDFLWGWVELCREGLEACLSEETRDVEGCSGLEDTEDGSMGLELEGEYDSWPGFGTRSGFGAGVESELDARIGTNPGFCPKAASGFGAGDGVGAGGGGGGGGEEWGT